jgi:hypothetical protein
MRIHKAVITIFLLFMGIQLRAQSVRKADNGVSMTVRYGSEYKFRNSGLLHYDGFSAMIDYHYNDILFGASFESGVRSKWFFEYNAWLNVSAGYVFHTGRYVIVPRVKTGWYFDADCLGRYDCLQCGIGIDVGLRLFEDFYLTGTLEYTLDDYLRSGLTAELGFRMNFRN